MAIPIFGFIWTERIACLILVTLGLGGLLVVFTSHENQLAAQLQNHLLPPWLPLKLNPVLLGVQSLLIMGGGIGAWRCTSFALAMIGVVAAMFLMTSIGMISFLPGMWMLFLLRRRWRAFFPGRYGWFPNRDQ